MWVCVYSRWMSEWDVRWASVWSLGHFFRCCTSPSRFFNNRVTDMFRGTLCLGSDSGSGPSEHWALHHPVFTLQYWFIRGKIWVFLMNKAVYLCINVEDAGCSTLVNRSHHLTAATSQNPQQGVIQCSTIPHYAHSACPLLSSVSVFQSLALFKFPASLWFRLNSVCSAPRARPTHRYYHPVPAKCSICFYEEYSF